jgi:hypothetical protein
VKTLWLAFTVISSKDIKVGAYSSSPTIVGKTRLSKLEEEVGRGGEEEGEEEEDEYGHF